MTVDEQNISVGDRINFKGVMSWYQDAQAIVIDEDAFEIIQNELTSNPVTVTFWHTMSQSNLQPILNRKITEFKNLYPNITINQQQVGGYNEVRDSILTSIPTKTYPSMAY